MPPRKRKLEDTKNDEDVSEGAYKCHLCGQAFIRGCGLASHLKKHKPVVYECPQCDYSCKHRPTYEKHYAVAHLSIMGSGPLVALADIGYDVKSIPILVREIKQDLIENENDKDYKSSLSVNLPRKMNLRVTPKVTPKMADRDVNRTAPTTSTKTANNESTKEEVRAVPKFTFKAVPSSILKAIPKDAVPAVTKKELYNCPVCPVNFDSKQRMSFHLMVHRTKSHQAPIGTKYFSKKLGERAGFFKMRSSQMKKWRLSYENKTVNQKRAQRQWHMELNFGHPFTAYAEVPIMKRPFKSGLDVKQDGQISIKVNGITKQVTRKKLKMKCGVDFGQKLTFENTHFYLCRECPFTSWNVSSLWKHFRNHVQRTKLAWTCICCSYTSAIRAKVDLHVKLHKDYSEDDAEFNFWCRFERRTNKSDLDKPQGRKKPDVDHVWAPVHIASAPRRIPSSTVVAQTAPVTRKAGLRVPISQPEPARPTRRTNNSMNTAMPPIFKPKQLDAGSDGDFEVEYVKDCLYRKFVLPANSKFAPLVADDIEPPPKLDKAEEQPVRPEEKGEDPPQLERMTMLSPKPVSQVKVLENLSQKEMRPVKCPEPEIKASEPVPTTTSTKLSLSKASPPPIKALSVNTDTPTTSSAIKLCARPTPSPCPLPSTLTPNKSMSDANAEPKEIPVKETKKEQVNEPINKPAVRPASKHIAFPVAKPTTRAMTKSGAKPLFKPDDVVVVDMIAQEVVKAETKLEIKIEVATEKAAPVHSPRGRPPKVVISDVNGIERPVNQQQPVEESMEPVRKSSRLSIKKRTLIYTEEPIFETEPETVQEPTEELKEEPIEGTVKLSVKHSPQPMVMLSVETSLKASPKPFVSPIDTMDKSLEQSPTKSSKESSIEPMMELSRQVSREPSKEPSPKPSAILSREAFMERFDSSPRPPMFREPLVKPKYTDFIHFGPSNAMFGETRHHVDTMDLLYEAMQDYNKKLNAPIPVSAGIKLFKPLDPIAQAQVGRNNAKEYLLRERRIERSRQCEDCPFKNKDLNKFRLHRDHHYHNGKFKCIDCNYAGHRKQKVKEHMFIDHYLSDVRQVEGLPSSESESEEEEPPPPPVVTKERKRRRRRANW